MSERIAFPNGVFCPACQENVFNAYVTLSDEDALSALERSDSVLVVHHPQIPDGTASGTTDDHRITLTGPERENLRRQLMEHNTR